MSIQDDAKTIVDAFRKSTAGGGIWINLNRATIADELDERINDPDKINQGQTSLCGPADFIRTIAIDSPDKYAKAAIDLFETGSALINTFKITPGKDLKIHKLSATSRIAQADWILLASIRDTDNWWFDYQSENDDAAAITMPHSKEKWLKQAGYTDVINETNVMATKDLANARKASALLAKGYKVALFINSNMLDTSTQDNASVTPDHWVALTQQIVISGIAADPASKVSFRVYTWGAEQFVPTTGSLYIKQFLWNYYGFIACKK